MSLAESDPSRITASLNALEMDLMKKYYPSAQTNNGEEAQLDAVCYGLLAVDYLRYYLTNGVRMNTIKGDDVINVAKNGIEWIQALKKAKGNDFRPLRAKLRERARKMFEFSAYLPEEDIWEAKEAEDLAIALIYLSQSI